MRRVRQALAPPRRPTPQRRKQGRAARGGQPARIAGEHRAARRPALDAATQAEGRVLVLYWWASWCPFCALARPARRQALARAARGPRRGLRLLTFSIDRRPDEARAHLRKHLATTGPPPG
ncbi:MAG: hypothetical protein U1F49_01365 [Rubrivivax sp.]